MPIIAKASGGGADFIPAPAGTWSAICVDVVDLGIVEVTWGKEAKRQHKIRIAWQIEERREDNKPFLVSKRYTLSLHEKASLRKDLESWRGRAFSDAELEGFDVENVIGISCYLSVIHTKKDGKTWANISAIMKLPKGAQAPASEGYVRVKDRPDTQAQPEAQPDYGEGPEPQWSVDDVPF